MLQLIDVFQSQSCKITYASTSINNENAVNLNNLGIDSVKIQLNNSNFDTFLTDLKPDIVIFDRFIIEEQFGWRVNEILPNTILILDTEDLHCLRKTREIAYKNNKEFKEIDLLKSDISKREIASILRCDLSLIISTYEIDLLKHIFKIDDSLLHYIPFLFDKITEIEIDKLPNYNERENFYFIGNFLHNPNFDAVKYLKKDIWPIISKQLPKAELHIFGAYTQQKVLQLNNEKERFFIKGKLNNLNELKKYKVCLAPLRFGAGIKGKLTETMLFGTPNITTKIGAEAMHNDLDWNGFITDNTNDFCNNSIKLYQNENIWYKSQQNGFKIINTLYNKDNFKKNIINKIGYLLLNLDKHRSNNFLGSILIHHTLKSTKYLSKWIEEKNKNL